MQGEYFLISCFYNFETAITLKANFDLCPSLVERSRRHAGFTLTTETDRSVTVAALQQPANTETRF